MTTRTVMATPHSISWTCFVSHCGDISLAIFVQLITPWRNRDRVTFLLLDVLRSRLPGYLKATTSHHTHYSNMTYHIMNLEFQSDSVCIISALLKTDYRRASGMNPILTVRGEKCNHSIDGERQRSGNLIDSM